MSPNVTRLLAASFAAATLACGTSASRVKALQDQNRLLRAQVEATDQAARAGAAYAQQLEGGGDGVTLLFTAEDIDRLAQGVLPYKMPAKQFNPQLSGEIHVERITNVRFLPGNRLTCQAHLRGVGIRVNAKVPQMYKAQVDNFLRGVASGVVTDLDVTLTWHGNALIARAEAKRSQMRQHRDASNEARLTREMNERALRRGLEFDLTPEGTGQKLQFVGTTATHLVVGYGP